VKSLLCLSFLSSAIALSVLFEGVDAIEIQQDVDTAMPWVQLVAFSTMAVNNGLAIAKQLGDSKDEL
jgi:hypothetical protein